MSHALLIKRLCSVLGCSYGELMTYGTDAVRHAMILLEAGEA